MSRLTSRLDDLCVALTGQDAVVVYHQLQAIAANVISWLLVLLRVRVPALRLGRKGADSAVLVLSPGGFERFALEPLPVESVVTVGYNVTAPTVERLPTWPPPGHAIVRIKAFSVNYADVTIRWGLYESAIKYVGYPICPGFDFAGVVERVGPGASVQEGDTVVGITFFGAYSERVLVPCHQLFAVPKGMSIAQAAALPSVSGTALHALALAGLWPSLPASRNRAVLVHSAAGGVGSMLVQMAKAIGCHPIVAVVGASHKVAACEALGATAVIDKSKEDLWSAASKAAPGGYCAIFDANGVQTLARSYSALAQTGTLVIYGFHTNLPTSSMLNPLAWVCMLVGILRMPRFDPMDLVLSSKSVAGFNLSFFAGETRMVGRYFEQILAWVEDGSLTLSNVTTFPMDELPRAHEAIQSGQSIGKLVCLTRHAGD